MSGENHIGVGVGLIAMDEAKVHTLHGGATIIPTNQPEIVAKLEEFLTLARDGQITGFVYGVVKLNRNIGTGWVGNADSHDITAAAAILSHRVLACKDD